MSVIAFPRREVTVEPRRERRPKRGGASTPRRSGTDLGPRLHHRREPIASSRSKSIRWRTPRTIRRSVLVVAVALAISLAGTMLEANRQIQLHQMQTQLLQDQSSYAVQVGSLTNLSAPSQIANQAGALHLVDPTSVIQVPTTSLDKPLPLPRFTGYAPAVSRTSR